MAEAFEDTVATKPSLKIEIGAVRGDIEKLEASVKGDIEFLEWMMGVVLVFVLPFPFSNPFSSNSLCTRKPRDTYIAHLY